MWERRRSSRKASGVLGYLAAAVVGGAAVWAAYAMHWIG